MCVRKFFSYSSFSVQNFFGLFVLSLHESFMENKVHSAKSNSLQLFFGETHRDASKNPRQRHIQTNAKATGLEGQHVPARDITLKRSFVAVVSGDF